MYFRTPLFLPWLYPRLIWRMPATKKVLYLTFDDGPVPGPTDFVLETLAKFNANATFFCIGENVKKHPKQFEKIIAAGSAVGNHTFNHLNGWRTPDVTYLANVQKCSDVIAHTRLFRPPYGRIKRSQIKRLNHYHTIMWDVLTFDYSSTMDPDRSLRGSVAATRPGSIIVFHDSYKAERNLTKVLPAFLAHFSALGFEFRPLTEDLFAHE